MGNGSRNRSQPQLCLWSDDGSQGLGTKGVIRDSCKGECVVRFAVVVEMCCGA